MSIRETHKTNESLKEMEMWAVMGSSYGNSDTMFNRKIMTNNVLTIFVDDFRKFVSIRLVVSFSIFRYRAFMVIIFLFVVIFLGLINSEVIISGGSQIEK